MNMKRKKTIPLRVFFAILSFVSIVSFSFQVVNAGQGSLYTTIGPDDSDVTTVGNTSYIQYSNSKQNGRLFKMNNEAAYCVAENLHVKHSAKYYYITPNENGEINEAGVRITVDQAKRISYIINANIGKSGDEERLVKQAAIWLALGQISEGEITGGSDRNVAINLARDSENGIRSNADNPFETTGTVGFTFDGDTAYSNDIRTNKDVDVKIASQSGTSGAATIEQYAPRKWRVKVPINKITGEVEVKVYAECQTTEYNVPTMYMGVRSGHTYNNGDWATQFMVTNASMGTKTHKFEVKAELESMKIKIHKDLESSTGNLGNAVAEGAVYGVYSNSDCTQEVARLTIEADGNSNATDWLPMMKYYVREITPPPHTRYSDRKYTVSPSDARHSEDSEVNFGVFLNVSDHIEEGNLSVVKKDQHGKIVDGVRFRVTGPGGFDQTITTSGHAPYRFENIPVGTYYITELNVPENSNLYNEPTTRTKDVTVKNNKTEEFVRTNSYQRGRVTLVKKDAKFDLPKGSCTLEGAVYELRAKNEIREGETHRYNPDEVVRVVETNRNGETAWIEDLPVGEYYYIETVAPEGYVLNNTRIDVEIVGQDQDKSEALTKINNHLTSTAQDEWKSETLSKDKPIEVDLVLNKILGATDYEEEVNLAGCAFTATYIKKQNADGTYELDESQKYVSHGTDLSHLSGEDGKCYIDNLVYGTYLIHETDYPDEALPVEDFVAEFTKATGAYDGKVYDYTTDPKYRIVDRSKTIQINIIKALEPEFIAENGKPATDAKLNGAYFALYKDAECTIPLINEFTNEPVVIGPTDENGYIISGRIRTKNIWVKEKIFPKDMDENIVNPKAATIDGNAEGTTYKDMKYKVPANNKLQNVENEVKNKKINNKPDTTKVVLVKFDDEGKLTEDSLPIGAKVRITLDSNPSVYYDITIDKYGYIGFKNNKVKEIYYHGVSDEEAFTIPHGVYTLKEISESTEGSNKDWYLQNRKVYAFGENETFPAIEGDYDIEFMLDIVKKDADTDAKVILPEAGYMVYSKETEKFVELKVHDGEDGEPINVFYTNNEGHLKLPEAIPAGEYVLYEVKAPKGYYLDENLRLPYKDENNQINTSNPEERITYINKNDPLIDQSKLGKEEFGGKLIPATKENLKLPKDAEYPTNPVEAFQYALENLVYTSEVENTPNTFQINLYKTGDMFTGIKEETIEVNGEQHTQKIPQFTKEGLNGVTFKITAIEDIKSEDGTQTYRNAGWSTTMTTGENGQAAGYATSEKLYNGKYRVEETVTPVGYKKCEPFEVDEHNYDQYTEVLQVSKAAENKYQPTTIKFRKLFENQIDETYPIYIEEGETLEEKNKNYYAVFGLYNRNEVRTVKNNITIPADTLMYVTTVKSGEEGKLTALMPDGEYYFQELYVTAPYNATEDKYPVTVDHRVATNVDDAFEVNGPEMENYVEGQDFVLLKASTTDILKYYGINSVSSEIDKTHAQEKMDEYSTEMTQAIYNNITSVEEIANHLREEGIRLLGTAEYELYADEQMTKHMMVSYDGVNFKKVVVTSDKKYYPEDGVEDYNGIYTIPGLPEGGYYLKETVAPTYIDKNNTVHHYKLHEEPIYVEINNSGYEDQRIKFTLISDDSVRYEIDKTDIFTDEGIENCLFKITDEEGKELLKFATNGEGKANIPTDIFQDGETYYFTELDAPKYPYYDGDVLYELNTEPHKFTAHLNDDGKWIMEYVDENGEKQEYERIEIQNYRTITDVELTKLDMVDSTPIPNCKFVLKGIDTNFEEEGVTDENGIYIFKDVPYGKYTYTELEAPDGWMIDTTPHEFTLDSHGTKIVVYDERAIDVNTGDIAVMAIACIALVSVVGIALIVIKNKKASSK